MANADPVSVIRIRNVPRSVRLMFGAQAKEQGIAGAEHLAALVQLWKEIKQQQEETK